MGWRKDMHRAERGYHHGNLKEDLVRAAVALIAEKGAAGFTFADAARWAGVSAAAPYRHFRDREDLLSDVARRGFELFEQALAEAWADGKPHPRAAFERLGKAYLAFARQEPAYYTAMFESGIPVGANPALNQAAERAFGVLRNAAGAVVSTADDSAGGIGAKPPALMVGLHIWAMAHGIASLFARADAARRPLPMSPEELLEAGVLIYLKGLGVSDLSGPAR